MAKSGPAQIRMTFSRPFSVAELEYLGRSTEYIGAEYAVTARMNGNQRLYLESKGLDSRKLFDFGRELVESTFVNVFPTAVRTFRELG